MKKTSLKVYLLKTTFTQLFIKHAQTNHATPVH